MQPANRVVVANEFTLEADHPPSISAKRINTPTIEILLGSTPSIAALELMRHMLTLKADDRRRVALVYIDTDEAPSALIEFRRQHNGVFQEFPLRIVVPAGISHVQRVSQDHSPLEPHTFIEGKEPQYFSTGAGGIRNNGHVAACFNHQHISDVLDRALATVVRLDTSQGVKRANEIQVNIVAFLGGGTGSGILADIAVMTRDLLINHKYQQRINLFCMLPEPIRGASVTDLSWRKSNSTACLLELIAYSGAAATQPGKRYRKHMRDKYYLLTNEPIANEIYLIGHAAMDDASNTARIVGLDLFQRATDASGVGFLEHSKWVDRRTLSETDDRSVPTMFGTSCPLEVRFPATETATTFARTSASYLLPLLASYQPGRTVANEADKRTWDRKWKNIARIDGAPNDPDVIKIPFLKRSDFEEADQARLDFLWSRLERSERDTERQIRDIIGRVRAEEIRNINKMPRQQTRTSSISLLNLRIQHLQHLQEEYNFALDIITGRDAPRVPPRPTDLEGDLTQPGNFLTRLRHFGRDHAQEVYDAYNVHIHRHALASRQRMLEQLIRDLLQNTQEALDVSLTWFQNTEVDERAQELYTQGQTSSAWLGYLENPHPHQRHLFDLRTLRTSDGRNIAVERLYLWAAGGDRALFEGTPIDYSAYVTPCIDYLTNKAQARSNHQQDEERLEELSAGRLADRVVDFFYDLYMGKFEDLNLFEILERAVPFNQKGVQARSRQMSGYLLEHLQHIRNLMAGLIAFEPELWHKGLATLDTSVYLGIHWRQDTAQKTILDQALNDLGPVTSRGQASALEVSLDPHRLQVVYGQHAISLSTIRDFYMSQNSAMEAYLHHQKKWEGAGGFALTGLMPTHSCSEAQRLVRDPMALGYKNPPTPLYERIIRQPFTPGLPTSSMVEDDYNG
jgi:hypothetical protein